MKIKIVDLIKRKIISVKTATKNLVKKATTDLVHTVTKATEDLVPKGDGGDVP